MLVLVRGMVCPILLGVNETLHPCQRSKCVATARDVASLTLAHKPKDVVTDVASIKQEYLRTLPAIPDCVQRMRPSHSQCD
jgi:hypothetical protein